MSNSNKQPKLYLGWSYDKVEKEDKENPFIDKIGGKPVWLKPNCPPPVTYSTCDNCGERLFLLMQLQGYLEKRKYDRIFYVWGCNNSKCMGKKGSFKVLRAHKGTHYNGKNKLICEDKNSTKEISDNINKEQIIEKVDNKIKANEIEKNKSNVNDFGSVINNPTEYQKNINSQENNDDILGFGNSNDFSWGAPDDFIDFGNTEDNADFGFGSTNNEADDDLNKLLELRDKIKYKDDEYSDDFEIIEKNNTSNKKNKNNTQQNNSIDEAENVTTIKNNNKQSEKENKSNEISTEIIEEDSIKDTTENNEEIEKINSEWNDSQHFPDYYLEVDEYQPELKDEYEHEKKLIEEYEKKQNKISGGGDSEQIWADEKYEKTGNKYFNKIFRKFNEVVQEEPEQCLRYSVKGNPLFYNNDSIAMNLSNSKNIPRCEKCGAPRTFEFQLMPNVLSVLPTEKFIKKSKKMNKANLLKKANNISPSDLLEQFDTGMEWGTLLVYTCSKDCDMDELKAETQGKEGNQGMWREDVSYYEEFIVAQLESLF